MNPFHLSADAVHVWWCDLDALPLAVDRGCLSSDEQVRAARWHRALDRARFVAGRAWLRHCLGHCLGRSPRSLRLTTGAHGKPALDDADVPLQFNLSHSGAQALLAVTLRRAVGVDLERIQRNDECESIARRHFAHGELEQWLALPPARRLAGFYAGWTRKEAFVKALGGGLAAVALDSFEVSLDPDQAAALRSIDGSSDAARRWSLWSVDAIPGFAAAVVAEGAPLQLQMSNET